jgi:hypothetical protein
MAAVVLLIIERVFCSVQPSPARPSSPSSSSLVVSPSPSQFTSLSVDSVPVASSTARGEACFKCGEKWSKEHTCPTTVQLHIVEELLLLMGMDALGFSQDDPSEEPCSEIVHAISLQAVAGSMATDVIQVQGWLQGQ